MATKQASLKPEFIDSVVERLRLLMLVRSSGSAANNAIVVDGVGGVLEQLADFSNASVNRYPSFSLIERFGLWLEDFECVDTGRLLDSRNQKSILGLGRVERRFYHEISTGLLERADRPVRIFQEDLAGVLCSTKSVSSIFVNDSALKVCRDDIDWARLGHPLILIQNSADLASDFRILEVFGYQLRTVDLSVPVLVASIDSSSFAKEPGSPLEQLISNIQGCVSYSEIRGVLGTAHLSLSGSEIEFVLYSKRDLSFWSLPAQSRFPLEGDLDGEHWCWTGPRRDFKLLIPVASSGIYRVTLHLSNVSVVGASLSVFVDGMLRGFHEVLQKEMTISAELGVKSVGSGWAELKLVVSDVARHGVVDVRLLGLRISSIVLEKV